MQEDKNAADQVKDAAWQYMQRVIIVLLFFGGGVFLGYQLWGAGEMGKPALVERVAKLRVGDPLDDATDMGPLSTPATLERTKQHVADAVSKPGREPSTVTVIAAPLSAATTS